MGKRIRLVSSITLLAGLIGAVAAWPVIGEAAEHGGKAMGGAMHTLSLTKDYTPSPWTHEVGYSKRAVAKLGFGVKNLLLGWTKIISDTTDASKSGKNVAVGFGMGLKEGLEDELGGAVHVATFPITCLDAPLPGGGVQFAKK